VIAPRTYARSCSTWTFTAFGDADVLEPPLVDEPVRGGAADLQELRDLIDGEPLPG